jgi:hypothetical protein
MESLIGKKYISSDNSHSKNLTGKEDYCLAGTDISKPKEAIIVSEPYKEKIFYFKQEFEYTFINVNYKKNTIRVLYFEKNVNVDLKTRIKEHNKWLKTLNLF